MIDAIELLGGLVYLLVAGDFLVRGALALARRADVSPLAVGLTVVAFGTSAPELVVSVQAVLVGHPGISIGNVVGSNTANVLLVVGLPAMLRPTLQDGVSSRAELVLMLLVSLAFALVCGAGPLLRSHGLILLVGLALYVVRAWRQGRAEGQAPGETDELERPLGLPERRRMIVAFLLFGAIGLPIGAELAVHGAVGLAERFGVSEAVIGLTIIALGTSLPELATTLIAAVQRQSEIGIGNVVGSNLFNILAIMGATATVAPMPLVVPASFPTFELPVMVGSAAMLVWLAGLRGRIGRGSGSTLVACYVAYLVLLLSGIAGAG